jgi:NitT/TauT family transport system substrate-binding protein
MGSHKLVIGLQALLGLALLSACAGLARPTPTPELPPIRVAFASAADFGDLMVVNAHERLATQGYQVITTYFSGPEMAVEALSRGDADIGLGSVRMYWAAAGKGARIRTIMEQLANEWQIVAISDIRTCADLHGRRLGFGVDGAAGTVQAQAYLQRMCPDARPNVMYVPGSSNRVAALLADQMDATTLELADAVDLEFTAPGRFHVLTTFSHDQPDIKTTGVQVGQAFAEAHPQAVRDYVRALLTVHREYSEDVGFIAQEATKRLEIEPELARLTAAAFLEISGWDVNGGLTAATVQHSLDFYAGIGSLPSTLVPSDVCDLSFLNDVLDEIGRR